MQDMELCVKKLVQKELVVHLATLVLEFQIVIIEDHV